MVSEQLCARGIHDRGVLAAMRKIERHKFVPPELAGSAYEDYPVAIGEGQTISQPYIVALMTQSLGLSGTQKVLEIGTGSGYQTAVLAELSKEVYSIERIAELGLGARSLLAQMGIFNVSIKIADGTLGWPEAAPFDRIIITAASPRLPLPLPEQLRDNGSLVMPLGESSSQMLTYFEKKGAAVESRDICGCVFVPLIGKYGWKE